MFPGQQLRPTIETRHIIKHDHKIILHLETLTYFFIFGFGLVSVWCRYGFNITLTYFFYRSTF